MTVGSSVTGVMGQAAVRSLLTPAFLAVAGTAAIVTLMLYSERPRVTRLTVAALVPWMVAAASLSTLAYAAIYPAVFRPVVAGIGAYLTTYALLCFAWFAMLQFARGSRGSGRLPTYIGAMGTGLAVSVISTLLIHADSLSAVDLFWLAIAPLAAASVAGIVLLVLGLWYPETAAYTGLAGGVVVFGHALAAVGTAIVIVVEGLHTTLSWAIMNFVAAYGVAAMIGFDPELLWVGGVIWTRLVVAIMIIVALTGYTHRDPDRGNLILGLVAAVGVVSGVTALFSLVVSP